MINIVGELVITQSMLAELGEMTAALHSGANRDLARERAELATHQLNAALETDPHLAGAHRGLGRLRLSRDDASGALPHTTAFKVAKHYDRDGNGKVTQEEFDVGIKKLGACLGGSCPLY